MGLGAGATCSSHNVIRRWPPPHYGPKPAYGSTRTVGRWHERVIADSGPWFVLVRGWTDDGQTRVRAVSWSEWAGL